MASGLKPVKGRPSHSIGGQSEDALGSGNMFRDLGAPDPEKHRRKSQVVASMADAALAKGMGIASLEAGIEAERMEGILKGQFRDVDLKELERIAALFVTGAADGRD